MTNMIPKGYRVEETNERVPHARTEMVTRYRWRANRRCKALSKRKRVPFYRYEVYQQIDGRWEVVAMQNRLVPVE